ncbi:hypothetical protein DPMN_033163 [Dreissena polymorpha]|uniref:Uncharacterized protein n=1 Tax=Dreissena polymorpha TaxID=45954 RepID=A0A9D4RKX1_DREPO|nr:hypothetical protein DPMN_033156 [Dreissena polymorpha]KAH3869985.1 hypothetical protein DPMN_033163 [Dreissena polymorpha]
MQTRRLNHLKKSLERIMASEERHHQRPRQLERQGWTRRLPIQRAETCSVGQMPLTQTGKHPAPTQTIQNSDIACSIWA